MRKLLLVALLAPIMASAAVTTVVTPGLYDLFQGNKKIRSGLSSMDACTTAAELLDVTQLYTCRVSNKVQTTKVVKPPRPSDAIALEFESFTLQIRSTVMYGWDTNWTSKVLVAGSYVCDNAQFGDPYIGKAKYCKLGPPPEPLPPDNKPPDMHAGIPFDPLSIPTFQPGINYPYLSDAMPLPPGPAPGDWEKDGKWRFVCNPGAMTWDDPLVYPGQPGAAHGHLSFGKVAFSAYLTRDNIRTLGGTYSSCRGGNINQSAYWVPLIVDTGTNKVVPPKANLGYYATGFWRYMNDGSVLQPFPKGLAMIAGTPTATGPGGYRGGMTCLWKEKGYDRPGTQTDGSIPTNCVSGADELWQVLVFPQCWDGVNLDSPDHKSHMAYPVFNDTPTWTPERQYRCPSSHPVVVPELSYHVQYEIPDATRLKYWRLTSDVYDPLKAAGYSWHGDYIYGWDQQIADDWMIFCLRGQRNCGTAQLADGRVTLEFQGN